MVNGLDRQPIDFIAAKIAGLGFNCVRLVFALDNIYLDPVIQATRLSANPELVGLTSMQLLDRTVEVLRSSQNMKPSFSLLLNIILNLLLPAQLHPLLLHHILHLLLPTTSLTPNQHLEPCPGPDGCQADRAAEQPREHGHVVLLPPRWGRWGTRLFHWSRK